MRKLFRTADGKLRLYADRETAARKRTQLNPRFAYHPIRTCPRSRTEIQVGCIAIQPNVLNLKVMIASAVNVVLDSTQHWKIDHVISFSSLNASAMILIVRVSLVPVLKTQNRSQAHSRA